jgi:hypothetical protein
MRLCRKARARQYCVTTSTVLPLRQGALLVARAAGTLTLASDAHTSQCLFEDTPLRGILVRCRQVEFMNKLLRPAANTDDREDAEQERGCAEEHGMSVEAARNEAEQVRQLAEDARDVRDQQREALKQSDRSESDYATPLRPRAPPTSRTGAPPRLRGTRWWMVCALLPIL